MVAMLKPVQPYVEYILNQDYIIEFLCINNDNPKLQCNGKCHLAKELKKQKQHESESLLVSLENYPIGFVNILKINPVCFFLVSTKKKTLLLQKLYQFEYNYSAFQPPDLV